MLQSVAKSIVSNEVLAAAGWFMTPVAVQAAMQHSINSYGWCQPSLKLFCALMSLLLIHPARPSHCAAAAPRSALHTLQVLAGQPQWHSTVSVAAVAGASATAGSSMSCSTAAAAAPAAAAKPGPQEVPSGMDAEATLMEQLTSIPLISKAICRPSHNTGGRGVDIQVCCQE